MGNNREALAWDRVGRFLQDGGTTASDIAQRNVKMWASVSDHLRKGNKYTANDMASDFATSLSTAFENLEDVASMLSGPRPDNQIAHILPTAFLLLRWAPLGVHTLVNPVEIEVDPRFRSVRLPRSAQIRLSARSIDLPNTVAMTKAADLYSKQIAEGVPPAMTTAMDLYVKQIAEGVPRLRECLIARRRKKSLVYVVETINYRLVKLNDAPAVGQGNAGNPLIPGLYDGLVYLTDPTLALADLRIIVEGPVEPDDDDHATPILG